MRGDVAARVMVRQARRVSVRRVCRWLALATLAACGGSTEPGGEPAGRGPQISFVSDRASSASSPGSALYLADTSGARVTTLVGPPMGLGHAWSPDGRELVFTRNVSAGVGQLFVRDVETGSERQLTAGPFSHFAPAWSPDGRTIAYVSMSVNPLSSAWMEMIAPDGTGGRRLGSDLYAPFAPSWSPDSKRLVASGGTIGSNVIVVDAETGARVRTLIRDELSGSADWSPDGRWIVYAGWRGNPPEEGLYVMDADGGPERLLVDSALAPAWSLDGRRIAFDRPEVVSGVVRGYDIFVINADGTGLRNLTVGPGVDRYPQWRPRP